MRFALVYGERREAELHLLGECVGCGSAMIAKCGEVRVHHWAHRGRRRCDPWWETETEWHRGWKGRFPDDWQEIVHHAEDGERHIADVKTGHDWVLEFQHSPINQEERRSREAFYAKLMWVVDGTRRKRDESQFVTALQQSTPFRPSSPLRRVWSGEGALFRDWVTSTVHVFFDFGDQKRLWWLSPASNATWAYVMPCSVSDMVGIHSQTDRDGADEFDRMAQDSARAVTALRGLPNPEQLRRRPSILDPKRSPRRGRRL
jgi:hypothetical protein